MADHTYKQLDPITSTVDEYIALITRVNGWIKEELAQGDGNKAFNYLELKEVLERELIRKQLRERQERAKRLPDQIANDLVMAMELKARLEEAIEAIKAGNALFTYVDTDANNAQCIVEAGSPAHLNSSGRGILLRIE